MASYTITSHTNSSVSILVTNLASGDGVDVIVRIDADPDDRTYFEFHTAMTSTFSLTVSGLSPKTTYAVNVRHRPGGSEDGMYWIGKQTFTTKSSDIALWSWTESNGNATASQTSTAYKAITSKGNLSDFSYLVWNDMCAKVLEILNATNNSWDTTYASYSNTLMSASDKNMTARRFNSLRYNIGLRYATGMYTVSTGDIIYGDYFTTLMSKVNGWIDSL